MAIIEGATSKPLDSTESTETKMLGWTRAQIEQLPNHSTQLRVLKRFIHKMQVVWGISSKPLDSTESTETSSVDLMLQTRLLASKPLDSTESTET